MHPDFLLEKLTLEQLLEWEAYDKIDPVGEWRNDYRMAKLASLIENIFLQLFPPEGSNGQVKLKVPYDYMPRYGEKEKQSDGKQSIEEQKAQLIAIASSFKNIKPDESEYRKPTLKT